MMRRRSELLLTLSLLLILRRTLAIAGPCDVESGQSSIIVDIEESRGDQVNQSTVPAELPIVGTPGTDVLLMAIFPKGRTLFELDGKRLQLLEPLDRDKDNLSHIVFQLICQVKSNNRRKTIPVIVRVSDINDNAPTFLDLPYEANVSELTPIGTTIFQNIKAEDPDAGVNGLAEYFIVPWSDDTKYNSDDSGVMDGYGYFSINLPHQGQVTVNTTLDYERTQKYLVTIVASDRARVFKDRYSSTATLTINVLDGDDQEPSFIYKGCTMLDGACINPEYTSFVNSGTLHGLLNISPEKIQAVDLDTLESPIEYSIESGTPDSWNKYFEIDSVSGAVRQIAPVDSNIAKKFDLIIRAEEVTDDGRFTTAKLTIYVKPVDANPPVIIPSAEEGEVLENSRKGTNVLDAEGKPIVLTVTDQDLGPDDPQPEYIFELTTSFFDIDDSGKLIVNENNLDRDPPNPGVFRFQVVCREINGGPASSPVSLTVKLLDVNDNPPIIPRIPRIPINVPASDPPSFIYKIEATDKDEGENGRITYTIYHVSNNGGDKFKINPLTGVIESNSLLTTGSHYSISIRATDGGGLRTEGIIEINVVAGPNRRPPAFSARDYSAHISEGAAINSTVTTVTAKDPENEQVTYSILSGNDLRQFSIGSNTGIITVIRKLDREDLTRYQLLIKAEDPGKLSSTATVNIKITDINDNNPEFNQDIYVFKVNEGYEDEIVGRVHATDSDEGLNAVIHYSLPNNVPFKIDNNTGELKTKMKLDYEKQTMYEMVVTARDSAGSGGARIGTATVSVLVQDVSDEKPYFEETVYKADVPENQPGYPVAQVRAIDPDTIKQITYVVKRGDLDLFTLDRKTGTIRTLRPLDREKAARHMLIIGTEENESLSGNAVATVEVHVEDKNDNAPIFTIIPQPVTIDDTESIGSVVATLIASDADALPPNNIVRYQIAGRGKASKYFQVDPDTGAIRVRDQLTKETDTEYTVDVRAYDEGDPQLSSVVTLPVFVTHATTYAPDVGIGFADNSYTEHISENAKRGSQVRILPIVNKHHYAKDIPLECIITDGNQGELFYTELTEDRDCAIHLNTSSLDYEAIKEYSLELRLDTFENIMNNKHSKAKVKIHVTDENDNSPAFIFPEQSIIEGAKGKYFAVVTAETLLDTAVVQVKAKDNDSGENGKIEYQKHSWSPIIEEYFNLDSDTGIIRNIKTFENIQNDVLPFKFNVVARDNPKSSNGYNIARASVIINLLRKENQLVLEVYNVKVDELRRQTRSLLNILENKSKLICGIEKLTEKENNENQNEDGTEVWFYVIDPNTGTILESDSEYIKTRVASNQMRTAVSSALQATVGVAHAPIGADVPPPRRAPPPAPAALAPALPAALLALSSVVLLVTSAAVAYICASWNRYKKFKERSVNNCYGTIGASTLARPSYDPPEPSERSEDDRMHRYETQVLNMSVNDDNDLQLDFSATNNHAFNIDNVSYLTKNTGERSPTLSEAATTARASSVNGSATLGHPRSTRNMPLNNVATHGTLPTRPRHHKRSRHQAIMAYDDIPGVNDHRSSDNDNVTFGKRNFGFHYDRSPVETTTEL